MIERLKTHLNEIIFALVNFVAGLICLLITKNPVAISIGADFIVGELGDKWILLLFLFLGLLLGTLGLLGKQENPQQRVFARKRQIGINILMSFWTLITVFFLCMFNSLDIIGSRVYCNIASLVIALLAGVLALFSKYFITKQTEDMFYNFRLSLSVFIAEVSGYVLLVVSYANIFVDNLYFALVSVLLLGLIIYLIPLIVTNYLKKKHTEKVKQNEEDNNASEEKILSAVNFASDMISEKATSKKKPAPKAEEVVEEKQPELAEEVVRSKKQTKKIAKQTTAKSSTQKSSKGTKKSATKKPAAKTTQKKKTTKSTSNYKGTSKTKNIK